MKATRISRPGEIEIVEIEDREPGEGQVAVRPLCLSLCGSDLQHLLYMDPAEYPLPVGSSGHEMVGVVQKLGGGVAGLTEGDLTLTLSPEHTAMTEQYLAEADCVLPISEGKPIEELLMAQQLGTVIYAARRLPNLTGASAVVIGQGSAGILWAQMLRRLGCSPIVVMDVIDSRVEAGRRFGADAALNNAKVDPVAGVREALGGRLADVVVEAAGEVDSINLTARLVRPKGILFYFGVPRSRGFAFDYWSYFRAYAQTFSSGAAMLESGKGSFRLAIDLISRGAIDVRGMVTHRFPLAEAARAFELQRSRAEGAIKVAVEMPLLRQWRARRRSA